MRERRAREKKPAHLRGLLRVADIVAVQEAHGTREEALAALLPEASAWHIVVSPGPDRNTGGLLTFFRKTLLSAVPHLETALVPEVLEPGRVVRFAFSLHDRSQFI